MSRWSYRRWDGSQRSLVDEIDDVFSSLVDDLLYHGDPDAALRRVVNSGFSRQNGERVQGLRELIERLRQQRQRQLEQGNPGAGFEEIRRELEQVVAEERAGLEELLEEARDSNDQRSQEVTEEVVAERALQLDVLPDDPAGMVRGLQSYEFVSDRARQHFEDLVERLRRDMASAWFDQLSEALSNPDPAQIERTRHMFDALNRMLEQRQAGEDLDPTFESFMDQFGDFFPTNPSSLDELLEDLAAQMAAMTSVLESLSAEQRAQLQQLADSLFGDLDLRWQAERLAANLRQSFPGAGWGRRQRFSGLDPFGLADAAASARRLAEMEGLEQFLRSVPSPGALAEVDLEQAARYLGEDGARSLESLARLARQLEEAGLIEQREGRYQLTAKGIRHIGQRALSDLFNRLTKDRLGAHGATFSGSGTDREWQSKPYEFGDPFTLDIERTVRNALVRSGAGTPLRLSPEDFEIERTESLQRCSTVLMVDLSLSMPMRDNFLAAKKVAIALHTLISIRFPRDFLGLVGFSEVAREIKPQELPSVSWDFVYGTNMQHGLILARRMLAHRAGTKQVIMITDGEPTAHIVAVGPTSSAGLPERAPWGPAAGAAGSERVLEGFEVFFNYPPVPETVRATLAEVVRCTKAGITINTFMLDPDRSLQGFVGQMTRLNRGRAFYTSPDTLGDYVLVDFLDQRMRARSRHRGA